ncbi:NAD(P)/FAD-dependent oxidoreductase [Rhodococcus opacus]|uniref:NAD(P)/FAD-dependent oxidoreductase n=1 Tax=Rhodococcus opacus TaxID=37919 RepID=UPI001C458F38|nr:FAD-binding oxidoreductase [Rhodococcus opacus]MBV6756864.1 FAD-binding oxidoreductase [Rhodococcus opacus]
MNSTPFPATPTHSAYDVVVIGGATSGSAVAWYLATNPDFTGSVLVVERDPSLKNSATIASNNCMRQQFATEINIEIAQYAAEFVKNFRENLGGDSEIPHLPIRNFGYLYLADNDEFAETLRQDQLLQAYTGAGTTILSREEIAAKYPFYRVDDIVAGSLNTVDEGAFDALVMVDWYRRKAREHGVDYIENEVVSVSRTGDRIDTLTLASGEVITAGTVVDAAGTRAAHVARMAGVDLPIEARRRYTYIFSAERPLAQDLPLTIDPTGVHMRSYGAHDYLVGCPPSHDDPAVDVDDFDYPEDIWENKMLPVITKRLPELGAVTVTDSWVGHYEFNTFDHNAIIGPHTEVPNLFMCNGFSGHGSQQAPACGRGVAELITYGEFRTLDLSALSHRRIAENRPLVERAVI